MEQLNGEILFWLLALGILLGLFTQFVMGKKGMGLIPNVVAGGIGTVIVGVLAIQIAVPGSLIFGLLGCLSILFLANVFNIDQVHDSEIRIVKKQGY